jgi:glycosyltransferase involved in cell wall biosynthesis
MRHATGQYIVTMDADRQSDPADIPEMIKLLDAGYDCVAGFRYKRQDNIYFRKIPSKVANLIIRHLWKSQLHDLGCALKAFKAEVSSELKLYGEMHRFIGILMEQTGAKVIEYKVNHRARTAGKSKYNLSRTFKVILDLFTLWFLKSYQTKPIYIFGGAGMFCSAASAITLLWTIFDKLYLGVVVHNNPLFLIAIFMAVVAVQFLVMGLIAELLIRTYFESTHQFPYSISKKFNFAEPDTALRLVK